MVNGVKGSTDGQMFSHQNGKGSVAISSTDGQIFTYQKRKGKGSVPGSWCFVYSTLLQQDREGPHEEVYSVYKPPVWSGNDKNRKGTVEPMEAVVSFLRLHQIADFGGKGPLPPWSDGKPNSLDKGWRLHTEAYVKFPDTEVPLLLRCHPDYQSEGPYYDWVMVKFEGVDNPTKEVYHNGVSTHSTQYHSDHVPARILAFVNPPYSEELLAIVHPADFREYSLQKEDSCFTEFWRMSYEPIRRPHRVPSDTDTHYRPGLCVVPVSSFLCRCLVIEMHPPTTPEKRVVKDGGRKENFERQADDSDLNIMLIRKYEAWGTFFSDTEP